MHIVDRLNFVNGLKDVVEDVKSTLLREIIQDLKDKLPQSYGENWNSSNTKL